MRILFLAAAVAALGSPAAGAVPETPVTETMTCPLGGGSFPFAPTASHTTTGERPDGKPYGSAAFPQPLPECPDNGLVLYKDYTAAEVAKLEPIVASEAYQALRKEDTPYYRAYWLMKVMGLAPERYLWPLLQASWEAEAKPELRKRYLTELAEASAVVPARPGDLNWIGMEGRAINALRELGRFDEALARLDKVPLGGLDVPVPASAGPGPAAQTRIRRGWLAPLTAIRPVIRDAIRRSSRSTCCREASRWSAARKRPESSTRPAGPSATGNRRRSRRSRPNATSSPGKWKLCASRARRAGARRAIASASAKPGGSSGRRNALRRAPRPRCSTSPRRRSRVRRGS